MSVLEVLLPIASGSSVSRDGVPSASVRVPAVKEKSPVKPVDQGPEQNAPARDKAQEKSFATVLDERLQTSEDLSATARDPLDDPDAVAVDGNVGGNVLPLQGDALPPGPLVLVSSGAPETLVDTVTDATTEPLSDTQQIDSTLASAVLPQEAAADLRVPVQTPPETREPLVASQTESPMKPILTDLQGPGGIAADAGAEPAAPLLQPLSANSESAEEGRIPAPAQPEAHPVAGPAASADDKALANTLAPGPLVSHAARPVQQQEVSEPGPVDAEAAVPEQDLAERVRAWRGLSQTLSGERMSLPRADSTSVPVTPLAHSGQFQQFADSLRQAVNQELSGATLATERSGSTASPAQASAADASSWRMDTALASTASTARTGLLTTPFSQVFQGSTFGQPLGERVGNNAWGERLSQRVSLMIGQKISSAQIQLDPPELGAMTVKVSVHGDQASVSFQSPHAVVRDVLEQSFPRLQEMLAQQGVQLADAQVSDHPSSGQGFAQSGDGRGAASGIADDDEMPLGSQTRTVQLATGLIDYYA